MRASPDTRASLPSTGRASAGGRVSPVLPSVGGAPSVRPPPFFAPPSFAPPSGVCPPSTPAGVQVPPWHVPPEHGVPSGAVGFEQVPVPELHVPARWHGSEAVQVTGLLPVQAPPWQVSVCVHALPSLHAVPSVTVGLEQLPELGSHVPAAWHWSDAVQLTGLLPVQAPPWQVSVCVHALPSLHAVPSAAVGLEQVPVDGRTSRPHGTGPRPCR